MFGIVSVYTQDHDSAAGYSGRIGFRYKTVVTIQFKAEYWNRLRRTRAIGHAVLDVGNFLYKSIGFTQTYSPQVDTKARAKRGVTTVRFEYFHNAEEEYNRPGYVGYAAKYVQQYQGDGSQYELMPK
ncbi:MAG: hypothetical protein HC836_46885 [Richelia sp. RM2_1_2]|nr:hypothetical protein [Richelia sp. RM2_1_2]